MDQRIPFRTLLMPYLVCFLAALFYIYDYFIQVSPAVITSELMRAFHIEASGLSFLGACFFYSYASMQIPAGLLLDRFGARRLLSFAILISGIGVSLFGYTHDFMIAGLARFFIGFGSAFAFISALFLATHWFEHRYFALIAGLVQLGGCLGSVLGEAPLAHVMNAYGWRHTLLMTGGITLVLALLYWLIIRDYPPGKHAPPRQKMAIDKEWQRLKHIFSIPQVWWISLCGFFSWIPVATFGALWGVPYLMKVFEWRNTQAAAFCSIFWVALGLSSVFIGWWSNHIEKRKLPAILCFIAGLAGSILMMLAPYLPVAILVFALVLLGSSAAIQSLTFALIKDILPEHLFGTASGFVNMMAIIAGGVSQQVAGLLLGLSWDHTFQAGSPLYHTHNYQQAMLMLPCASLIGLIIAYFKLKETNCQPLSETPPQVEMISS